MLSTLQLIPEFLVEAGCHREEIEKRKLFVCLLEDGDLLDALHQTPNDIYIIHEVGHRIQMKTFTIGEAVDRLPPNTDVVKFLRHLLENVEIALDVLAYTRQAQIKDEMLTRWLVEILLNTGKFDQQQAFEYLKQEGFLPDGAFVLVTSWSLVNNREISEFLDIAAKELTFDTIADISLTLSLIQLPVISIWLTCNGFLWTVVRDRLDKETLDVINNQV